MTIPQTLVYIIGPKKYHHASEEVWYDDIPIILDHTHIYTKIYDHQFPRKDEIEQYYMHKLNILTVEETEDTWIFTLKDGRKIYYHYNFTIDDLNIEKFPDVLFIRHYFPEEFLDQIFPKIIICDWALQDEIQSLPQLKFGQNLFFVETTHNEVYFTDEIKAANPNGYYWNYVTNFEDFKNCFRKVMDLEHLNIFQAGSVTHTKFKPLLEHNVIVKHYSTDFQRTILEIIARNYYFVTYLKSLIQNNQLNYIMIERNNLGEVYTYGHPNFGRVYVSPLKYYDYHEGLMSQFLNGYDDIPEEILKIMDENCLITLINKNAGDTSNEMLEILLRICNIVPH